MKKQIKIISVLMSLIMVLSIFSIVPVSVSAIETALASSGATSGTTGDCTWRLDGTTLTISGNGSMSSYSDRSAPWYSAEITDVVIEEGVTYIGNYSFYGCTGLTSLTIPDSVTWIGGYAFYGCTGLTSVTIPDSITSIGSSAFRGCTGLTSVTIPNSVTSIGDRAFSGCTGLTSVTIPDSVTSIGNYAFYGCTGLTSVHISDIAAWCSISFATYSDGYNYNNPLEYAHHLYLNGELVTDLTIPDSVTSIGSYAFSGCTGLTSVTIPDSVTSIGSYAFYRCTGLTSVTIPGSVTSIGYQAFGYDSDSIKISGFTIYGIYGSAAQRYAANNGFNFVASGEAPTGDCTWRLDGTTLTISGKGNMGNYDPLYSDHAPWYSAGITDVVIENGVTNIGLYAFSGCASLKTVNIGNTVKNIEKSAFSNCDKLTGITLPNSVNIIGERAFSDCSALETVNIPNAVKVIGNNAFYNCDKLTSVTLPNSVNIIGENAFSGCDALASVTMSGAVTDIGERAFYDCPSLTSVTIPDSVTNIDTKAFGWYRDVAYGLNRKVNNFTIKGYEGSMAETYAHNNGFLFVSLLAKTGDADGDGEITVMDATEVQYLLAGLKPHVDESLIMFADVDQNGLLEIIDVTYILRHVAGEEVPYPIG